MGLSVPFSRLCPHGASPWCVQTEMCLFLFSKGPNATWGSILMTSSTNKNLTTPQIPPLAAIP